MSGQRPVSRLRLRGAHEHNLRGIDLDLQLGQWIAVTGPSGSGKTTLAFDTLVREGQSRFLGGLSARARHFFGKLGRADVAELTGLPAPIAIGQHAVSAHPRSTVGTLCGGLDLLRLLFARTAIDPDGTALTRSHFSFNVAPGACEACGGLGVEDHVDPALLVADPTRSIRDGALVPTLKNGYTVYSQVTLEVMDTICQAHGFDVQTPWNQLSDEQRHVIFYGTQALRVPFGKHSIESRMRWEGITARPREEGYYRGLVVVIEETLARNRNPNILRFVRSAPCSACAGTRLSGPGRHATVGAFTLPALLALPTTALVTALDDVPPSPTWDVIRPSLQTRLRRMETLGLGHLALARASTTLSGGEAQRLRLAAQLTAGLGGMLVALDEPTLGLHPEEQAGMRAVLDALTELGNTLLVVEHDPDMVRHADHVVALGPGAGTEGGALVSDGPPSPHPLGPPVSPRPAPRPGSGVLNLRGATLHNLQDTDLQVHLGCFNVVLGRSGAGKTSLVFGTLLPALLGQPGGPFAQLEGAASTEVGAVDARPIGRTPRSTPATWSGLFELVRKRFADTATAKAAGRGPGFFSYNNKGGRCSSCEGLGVERVGLHLLEDVERPCSACEGGRYGPDALEIRLRGKTIADVLDLTVRDARVFFADDQPILELCAALDELGLGYLRLGQSSNQLSRGEAQRVKLATLLGRTQAAPSLLLLDEPDRGLHPQDIERLVEAIDALVDAGHTVLAISHHRHLWAAADRRTEIRDGVAYPDPELSWSALSEVRPSRAPTPPPEHIQLRGVRTHTLANLDVRVPHRCLTAIAGVSGSGKSSLAFDTLAAEAWHRYSESLPFSVRRFVRRQPRPELDEARGLTPTLALRQGTARAGRRSTVATQTEVGPLLRLLWSRAGHLDGRRGGWSAEHFSPDRPLGACPSCEGLRTVPRCSVERLVTDPSRSLADGAMAGTKPGKFFTAAGDQHLATLRVALAANGLDPDLRAPWNQLEPAVRRLALHGSGEQRFEVRWSFARGKRAGEHTFEGPWLGLLALVEREARRRAGRKNAEPWFEPLIDVGCPACHGSGLRPELAAVRLGELTLSDLMELPIDAVVPALDGLTLSADQQVVMRALRPELNSRLTDASALGLGHLALARRSQTLSAGELQRVRLASVLRSGLTATTIVLDEPTAGLHEDDVTTLLARLRTLCHQGNTVVVVSHRPRILRGADHIVELGPGGGPAGGRCVAAGPAAEVLAADGPTARALRAPQVPRPPRSLSTPLRIRGAHAHNLRDLDLDLPERGIVAVAGVSGSGKSTLLFDVIAASVEHGEPRGCVEATGFERFAELRTSRTQGRGRTPLTALQLMPSMQRLFADASGGTTPKAAFSYDSPQGRCETCRGSGKERVAMDFLADLELPCPGCQGRRYRPEVLDVKWQGWNVAEFLDTPVATLGRHASGKLGQAITALRDVGLGHLTLGRDRAQLSGGEAQRLVLAASLLSAPSPALYLLDEPGTGLHESDIAQLVRVFDRLAERGDLVLLAAHRRSLLDAADWHVHLGPGRGPQGGTLLGSAARPVSGPP